MMKAENLSARVRALCDVAKFDPRAIEWPEAPREQERLIARAIREERDGTPMPSGPAHQNNPLREARLLAKRLLIEINHARNQIAHWQAAEARLLTLVDGR